MIIFRFLKIFLLGLVFVSPAFAVGHYIHQHMEYGGILYPYAVYLPPEYDSAKSWPVILFLHGKGQAGTDGRQQITEGLGNALVKYPEQYPAIVVFPQSNKKKHWDDNAQDAALAVAELVIKTFHGDSTRLYLTGLSLGAFAAWSLAASYPEKFAAVVGISGAGNPAGIAKPLAQLPIWAFSGAWDVLVPPIRMRYLIHAIRKHGGNVLYTKYSDKGHNSWDKAYSEKRLTDWLFAQRNFAVFD